MRTRTWTGMSNKAKKWMREREKRCITKCTTLFHVLNKQKLFENNFDLFNTGKNEREKKRSTTWNGNGKNHKFRTVSPLTQVCVHLSTIDSPVVKSQLPWERSHQRQMEFPRNVQRRRRKTSKQHYFDTDQKREWGSTWKMCVSRSKLLSAKHTHHPTRSMRCFIRSVSKVFCSPKTECVLQFTRLWFRNSLRPSKMYGTKRSIALQSKIAKKGKMFRS